jgi:hypothetical protein
MALDQSALLKSVMTSIETYLDEYNNQNDSEVVVYVDEEDDTMLIIDGGTEHGTYELGLKKAEG